MPYNSMNDTMNRPQMNMSNISPNMPNIPMANMMPLNMQMLGENMIMMNPMMSMMQNQNIYITDGVLLPPIPGEAAQDRIKRPPGCRTIFVGGLPYKASFKIIEEIFQNFGTICDSKMHKHGSCIVRFKDEQSVESALLVSGYRIKFHDQKHNEARTLFVDYAFVSTFSFYT